MAPWYLNLLFVGLSHIYWRLSLHCFIACSTLSSSAPQNRLEPGSLPPDLKTSQSGTVQALCHRKEHESSWSARTRSDHSKPALNIDTYTVYILIQFRLMKITYYCFVNLSDVISSEKGINYIAPTPRKVGYFFHR